MLELRLYRFGLLLALAAAVVLMFSVVSRPEPLRSDVAADAFDDSSAAGLARRLVELAPHRQPGSGGDLAAASFVEKRFSAIQGGSVSVQRFNGSFDGDDVGMRNVSLLLPGLSDRSIVVVAPRDCGNDGPCAASSGAATAALLELASTFDGAPHQKTLLFVSTDGSTAGAAGAKVLGDQLADEPPEAVVVLSQPGSRLQRHPFVVPWSTGPQSTSIQLIETARAAVSSELDSGDPLELRPFSSLFRLAVPSGLLEQGVLIDRGSDAIGLSAPGDRPLPASEDGLGSLSIATLGAFGRSALTVVFALDRLPEPLVHGPDAYMPLAGKLIPGWALALLAIALLVPIGLVSVDGLARASRAREPVLPTLLWTLGRALPWLAVLVLAQLLSAVGLIARPSFPFDPHSHPFGIGPAFALLALLAAFVGAIVVTRTMRPPGGAEESIAPSIGLLIFVSLVAVWLINPFLALILVPTAHLWLAAALPELRRQPVLVAVPLLLGLLLPLVAVVYLASALGVGWGVLWQLVLVFTGGQIGIVQATAVSLLGGCLIAIADLAVTRRAPPPARHLGPRPGGRHRGPGALGGPPSTAVRGHKF
jgi:hypothetical protein